jgi:hypothetical protein
MPLSSSSADRRIPEPLSTSRGKPAGVSDGNWIPDVAKSIIIVPMAVNFSNDGRDQTRLAEQQ